MLFFGNKIDDSSRLVPMPKVFNKLIEIIDDPESSLKEIAKIVSLDASLSAKVLSIANTAIFSGSKQILDVNNAIIRLGRFEIKKIFMTVFISLLRDKVELTNLKWDNYWIHSLSVAVLGKKISENCKNRQSFSEKELSLLYISGLVHDIGLIMLDSFFPEMLTEIIEHAKKNKITLLQAEEDLYGTNHCVESKKFLSEFNIPKDIIDLVDNFYLVSDCSVNSSLMGILNVANSLSYEFGFHLVNSVKLPHSNEDILSSFEFNDYEPEEKKEFLKKLMEDVEIFISLASILIS